MYDSFDPPVIYLDSSSQVTLELATTNQGIAAVLSGPNLGPMYDDGTHGDRVAGDGIYSVNISSTSIAEWCGSCSRAWDRHGSIGFQVKVVRTDGTEETTSTESSLGVVEADQHFPAVRLGEGLYATDYAFFVVDPSGEIFDGTMPLSKLDRHLSAATKKLYSVFPDVFDFIVVTPSGTIFNPEGGYGEDAPFLERVKNDIQRIGLTLFDATAQYGSHGRLIGTIYHSFGEAQILAHEIGHAWGANFGKSFGLTLCEQCFGPHWNPYADIGGLMAAFVLQPGVQSGGGHLIDNGDGTWRIERPPEDSLFSKLDLYLMGLIPAEDVPPVHKLINPELSDPRRVTAERVETYTIQQLMQAAGGERIPPWQESANAFNVAFIVVGDKEFTPAAFAFFSLVAKDAASREQGAFLTPFYTATGGRASLNVSLRDVCAYGVSPTSSSFPASGGTGSVNVTAACPWVATSNTDWIILIAGSGTGDGQVEYSVAVNPDKSSRTGTMSIAGQTFTITQEGTTQTQPTPSPTPTSSGRGREGDGCAMDAGSGFGPTLVGVMVLILAYLGKVRTKRMKGEPKRPFEKTREPTAHPEEER